MTVAVGGNENVAGNYKAPDGGWGWVVVASSLIIHFVMDGITYALGSSLTVFVQSFEATEGEVSLVHSLLPAVTLSTGPIASMLTNRFGCRNTTIIGTLIAFIGFIISIFARKIFFLYITIGVIVGFGFGLIYVPAIVSVGFYFEKKRSLAIGIAVCGSGLGTSALSPINAYLNDHFGWTGTFLITAAFVLNMIPCGLVLKPVPVEPSEILKNKKKLKKKQQKNNEEAKALLADNHQQNAPRILVSDEKNLEILSEDETAKKYAKQRAKKITESLPDIVDANVQQEQQSNLVLKNSKESPERSNDFIKSMPVLAQTKSNSHLNINKLSENSKVLTYSAMDILAQVRSSQNIAVVSNNTSQNALEKSKVQETIKEEKVTCSEKLKEIIDVSLLKDPVFLFFAISNFLTSLGFNAPFIFITDHAVKTGMTIQQGSTLLSAVGFANTVGRILIGLVSDRKEVNRLYLYSALISVCGFATMLEPLCFNFVTFLIYSVVFGITSGGYVSLTSVLLVDLLGIEKLTNAFGILLIFQGVATAIGPPCVGLMYTKTQSYTWPFLSLGFVIGISGLMCFFIPCIKRIFKKK